MKNIKRKGIVLQSVDSPRRDLEWRIYLAYKLSEAGYDSIIGPKEEIRRIHSTSSNCIFLGRLDSNSGRFESDKRYIEKMRTNGTSLFFLHDEGAFYYSSEYEESTRRIYPEPYFSLPQMKKVFFWGERQRMYFTDRSYENKLEVVGFPRFDLCHPKYLHLDSKRVRRFKQEYGDFVLICGRFAAVNTVNDDPSYLSKRIYEIRKEGGSLGVHTKDEVLLSMFDSWGKVAIEYAEFLPAIAKLAIEHPSLNFVVRPHPAEKESTYNEALEHFDNVFVDKSGDVRAYIRAAKIVIQSECTTGVEAEISQVPHINFRPTLGSERHESFVVAGADKVGIVVVSYKELSTAINEIINDNFEFKLSSTSPTSFIENVKSGPVSAQLIVNSIAEGGDYKSQLIKTNSLAQAAALWAKLFLKGLVKNCLAFLGHKRFAYLKSGSGDLKNVKYDKEEIIEKWQALGGDETGISIKGDVISTKGQT